MTGRLLDTNAVIAYLAEDADFKAYIADQTDVFVPIISIGELFYGAYRSGRVVANLTRVTNFAVARKLLFCDTSTAQKYGEIKQALRQKGRPIPDNDVWIAAITKQHDLILVTRDQHFKEVEELTIESW